MPGLLPNTWLEQGKPCDMRKSFNGLYDLAGRGPRNHPAAPGATSE